MKGVHRTAGSLLQAISPSSVATVCVSPTSSMFVICLHAPLATLAAHCIRCGTCDVGSIIIHACVHMFAAPWHPATCTGCILARCAICCHMHWCARVQEGGSSALFIICTSVHAAGAPAFHASLHSLHITPHPHTTPTLARVFLVFLALCAFCYCDRCTLSRLDHS